MFLLVQIKCQNVIILSSTTVGELEKDWNCLLELTSSNGPLIPSTPFISRELRISLFDVMHPCLSMCFFFFSFSIL